MTMQQRTGILGGRVAIVMALVISYFIPTALRLPPSAGLLVAAGIAASAAAYGYAFRTVLGYRWALLPALISLVWLAGAIFRLAVPGEGGGVIVS